MSRTPVMLLLLLLCGFVHPERVPAQDTAAVEMRGRVSAADGGGVEGVWAFARAGAHVDSAAVDAAGRFALRLPAGAAREGVEVRLDAAGGAGGRHLPAAVRVPGGELGAEQGFVLAPREWTIPVGRYAGTRVAVRPELALKPLCEGCSSFYRRAPAGRAGEAPRAVRSWPERAYPLRVAFDREASVGRITARDSAAFWGIVEELEATLGSDLFRPASFRETLPRPEDDPEDVVLVRVDPTLRISGLGSTATQGSDIIYGELQVKWASLVTGPDGPGLVTHELMHTLGLGHTCAWTSVMAVATSCPSRRSESLTPEDVAYAQLLRRAREVQRETGARWGIEWAEPSAPVARAAAATP